MSISPPPIAPQLMLPAPVIVALLPATCPVPEPAIRPSVIIVEQAPRSRPKLSHLARRAVVDEMEELFDQMLGFLSGDVSETDFHAASLSFYKSIVRAAPTAKTAEKPPRPSQPPRNPFTSTPRDDAFDPSQMDARIRAAYERGYNRVH